MAPEPGGASRARFATKAGFVLSGVGAAVGLGNIWRFPQLASENGGAAFVAVYLVMMVLIGLPLLWGELSIGQRAQTSSVAAVARVAGPKWRWLGVLFVATSVLFFGYYQVIAGKALIYTLSAPTDRIAQDPASFHVATSEGLFLLLFALLFMTLSILIVRLGVARGLERANLVMMPTLFVIVACLALYGVTRPGAGDGIRFYLAVDVTQISMGTLLLAAGQVFFSVGIAFGIMLTYASYTARGRPMLPSAGMIAGSDLLVALLAGFMVFPLVFSLGLQDQVVGQDLGTTQALFLTLPTAFIGIGGPLGKLLMFAFFLMLSFAAMSSSIAGLEVVVSWLGDAFGWARPRATVIVGLYAAVLASIAAVSEAALGWMDNLLGTVMLVLGGIGIGLVYVFAIKDRVGLLLGGDAQPSTRMWWSARVVAVLLLVVPIVLAVLFLLNLPCTVNALFGARLPTPTC